MTDINEDAVLGQNNLEIGDRIYTYRDTLLDGKRLLSENRQLVDETEYPILHSLVPLSYKLEIIKIAAMPFTLEDKVAISLSSGVIYYLRQGIGLYEFDMSSGEYTLVYSNPYDNASSPFISNDAATIAFSAYDSGDSALRILLSADSGNSFNLVDSISTGATITSLGMTSNQGLSTLFFVAGSTSNDRVAIVRFDGATATTRKTISGLSNPVVSDSFTCANSDASELYFYESNGNDLYHYVDSTLAHTNINQYLPSSDAIACISFDISNDNLYVLFEKQGLYFSSDKGLTYTEVLLPTLTYSTCRMSVKNGVIAFYASNSLLSESECGAHISNDAGQNWSYVSNFNRTHSQSIQAYGIEVESIDGDQVVHLNFQEASRDEFTYMNVKQQKFLLDSSDPMGKVVADAPGA